MSTLFYLLNILSNNYLPLMLCLNLSSILFLVGLVGIVWNKQDFLLMILSIELMFFSISLNFIFFSIYTYTIIGQIFSLLIVTTAASETAIALSLLIISSRLNNKVCYNSLTSLRG